MDTLKLLLALVPAASVTMALLWVRQRSRDRADRVDVAWAYGVGVASALLVWSAAPQDGGWRAWLVGGVAVLWSLRLGTLLLRRVSSLPEDGRYAAMKRAWGAGAWSRMFWFFQAQALWVLLFALPPMLAARRTGPLDALDALAMGIALVAIVGEGLADLQLHRFRKQGHPNYFFEWLYWWSYVAFSFGGPQWWLTLLGPAVMLLFLFRLTGIPWTERQALASRGEAERAYQRKPSIFLPWPPRADAGETR